MMFLNIGTVMMIMGQEYNVSYINEKKNRFSIELINKTDKISLSLNQNVNINNFWYRVLYINNGRKTVTLKPNI
jgi:hypothetical protein